MKTEIYLKQFVDRSQSQQRKQDTQHSSQDSYQLTFNDVLQENGALTGAKSAAYSDFRRSCQKFSQKNPDQVERAHDQKKQGYQHQASCFLRDYLLFLEPLHHWQQLIVRGA